MHQNEIKLYPYRDQWHKAYVKETKNLERELAGYVFGMEHIGSTAVPDMSATLNIDILIGVDALAEIKEFESILTEMGYLLSNISHGPKHRLYIFDSQQGYHLHFFEARNLKETPYVKFRDALINDAKLAKEFKEYKIRLVGNYKCKPSWYAVEKSKWISGRLTGSVE